jgi:hypothetical protein
MSPLHLLIGPIFLAGLEVRVVDHFGIRGFGGAGDYTTSVKYTNGTSRDVTFGVQVAGAQLLAYPLEAFDSLVLGAEFQYVHVAGDVPNTTVSGVGTGTAIGPLIGYKLITRGGFTLMANIGAGYVVAHAEAKDSVTGTSTTQDDSQWTPFLNLEIGWSF